MGNGPSVMVRILGDVAGLAKSVAGVGENAKESAGGMHTAFSTALGALNQTGVLGPMQGAFESADTALSGIKGHGKEIAPVMAGVGTAVAGVGLALSLAGSKDQAAHQQLQRAVENTGQSYEKYGTKVEGAIKTQEHFGTTADTTQDALRILTQATGSPAKALNELGTAADLAAAKHESLASAATQLGKAQNGSTRIFKEFGVQVASTKKATSELATAQHAVTKANDEQATATQHLKDVHAELAGKTTLTTAEQIKLRDAQDKVTKASTDQVTAHAKLKKAHEDVATATNANGKAVDALGKKLKGEAAAGADTFGGKLKGLKATVEDQIAQFGQKYGPALTVAGTAMTGMAAGIEVAKGVTSALSKATKIQEGAQAALNIVMDANVFVLIALAVVGLVAGMILLYKHSQLVRDIVKDVGKIFTAAFTDIVKAGKIAFDWIKDHWKLIAALLLAPISVPLALAVAAFVLFHKQVAKVFEDVLNVIKAFPTEMLKIFTGALTWLEQAGKDIVNGLLNGLLAVWTLVDKAWQTEIQGWKNLFTGALKWLEQAGQDILNGLLNGLSAMWGVVSGAFTGAISGWKSLFGGAIGWLASAGNDIIQGLLNGINGLIGTIGAAFGTVKSAVTGVFGDAATWLVNAGKDIINGLVNGVTGAAHLVTEAIGKVASDAKNAITHPLSILSPSKVFMDYGANIMAGLAIGLTQGATDVDRIMGKVSTGLKVNAPAGTGALAPAASGPAVVIHDAHFATELDVDAFMRRAAMVARSVAL
jgi:hypothetical protein